MVAPNDSQLATPSTQHQLLRVPHRFFTTPPSRTPVHASLPPPWCRVVRHAPVGIVIHPPPLLHRTARGGWGQLLLRIPTQPSRLPACPSFRRRLSTRRTHTHIAKYRLQGIYVSRPASMLVLPPCLPLPNQTVRSNLHTFAVYFHIPFSSFYYTASFRHTRTYNETKQLSCPKRLLACTRAQLLRTYRFTRLPTGDIISKSHNTTESTSVRLCHSRIERETKRQATHTTCTSSAASAKGASRPTSPATFTSAKSPSPAAPSHQAAPGPPTNPPSPPPPRPSASATAAPAAVPAAPASTLSACIPSHNRLRACTSGPLSCRRHQRGTTATALLSTTTASARSAPHTRATA